MGRTLDQRREDFEFSKIEMKVTANREDVQLGIDVDSKITGLKGEGSYTVKKV